MSMTPTNLADQATEGAERAIRSTQRVANDTLGQLADGVDSARARATPTINRVADEAEHLARRSIEVLRNGSEQLRDKALRTSDNTIAYIREEPLKSVMVAAAGGALLMALATLLSRSRGSRH
ncbi:hypothetical protein [Rivibacter subsaxonicus]|uniref:ElaB/YqjD/DUF883 family membrane-anchored ribosome-binding protein n=1 Tax=Rivibacter subsaxonicus TaxID=457575 RepID=A0A4Q7VNQ2_9BURK|nr:hypothetical protein [Rivibacter subsaxonicus]RZT97758.1 hypothetical protein EV670_2152 [Rivibacter subsaxonicus]